MPAISTLRVDNSMKNSTMNRCSPRRVHTSTLKKSAATISSQCRLRNSFQVVFRLRSGAGSIPCRSRISAIVLRAIACPRLGQCALDPPIAPILVLRCESDHQLLDIDGCSRTPRSALRSAVVLVGDQLPMPGQQGLGRGRPPLEASVLTLWPSLLIDGVGR